MAPLRNTFENGNELSKGFRQPGNLDGTPIDASVDEKIESTFIGSTGEVKAMDAMGSGNGFRHVDNLDGTPIKAVTDEPIKTVVDDNEGGETIGGKEGKDGTGITDTGIAKNEGGTGTVITQKGYPVGHSLYLIDFILGLARKVNIPSIIYLILNVFIIGGICTAILSLPVGWGMLCGVILYLASINVALSPIGEWILRTQNACWIIDEVEVVNRIEPLFKEVYGKAMRECPNLSKDIRLFMMEDDSANAFATGRNTICITRGLLELSDEQIKGVLAHEFGHLANMDTDLILVVSVGNLIITGICMIFQLCVSLFHFVLGIAISGSEEGSLGMHICNAIMHFLTMVVIAAIMKVWTWIGTTLCMKTSRAREFEADKFAHTIGYGKGLYIALDEIAEDYPSGFFSNLKQSHPRGSDRLRKLAALEAVA